MYKLIDLGEWTLVFSLDKFVFTKKEKKEKKMRVLKCAVTHRVHLVI